MKPPDISPTRAFTLVEILVVVAIIAILAAFAVPTATRMIDRATATECTARLRAIGVASSLFTADNDGRIVTNGAKFQSDDGPYGRAFSLLGPYIAPQIADNNLALRQSDYFRCPSLDNAPNVGQQHHYPFNLMVTLRNADGTNFNSQVPTPLRMAAVSKPDQTPLAWDTSGDPADNRVYAVNEKAKKLGYTGPTSSAGLSPQHGKMCNILYLSGRVAPADLSSPEGPPYKGNVPTNRWPTNTDFDPLYDGY